MQRYYLLLLAFLTFSVTAQAQNAWINEFHYDNDGADAGEFVEVVIQDTTTNLPSDFQIDLYNGSGGASYDVINVDTDCTVGDNVADYVFFNCAALGLQNGAPDGVAISYQGTLISGQFLSYEGTFTATNGPANGVLSTDVGISEVSTTPIGESLQLTGTGAGYDDFTWSGPIAETPGAENTGQAIEEGSDLVVTCTFTGSGGGGSLGGGGSDIPPEGGRYFYDFVVTNNGTSPATVDVWMDVDGPGTDLTFGPYTTRTVSPGGSLSHSYKKGVPGPAQGGTYTHTCHVGTFDVSEASDSFTWTKDPPNAVSDLGPQAWNNADDFATESGPAANTVANTPGSHLVEAAYPNPFNPEATFRFSATEQQNVRAELVDVLGRVVATLFDGNVEAGAFQTIRIDGSNLPSGSYVIRIVGETFADARSVTLLK